MTSVHGRNSVFKSPFWDIICKLVGSGLITLFEFDSVALSGDTGKRSSSALVRLEKKLSSCSYILHAVPSSCHHFSYLCP